MNALSREYHQQPVFFKVLAVVFVFKLLLANWIPLTSDEAYFIVWGKNLDYGFYDHTPFVGWLLAAFLSVSDALWWLRLPAVLLPLMLTWGIYKVIYKYQPETAFWVALAYLAAPVNTINVLITTDIPLILFSFVSAWFFYRANIETANRKQNIYYLGCGLFLGLAFFSKYFAVLLGIAYGLYIVILQRNKTGFKGLALILLMVMPFAMTNITWNYNNCWNNILFNLFNRTAAADNVLDSFISFVILLMYLFFPFIFVLRGESRKKLVAGWQDKFMHIFLWLSGLPLLIFFFLLFRKEIGLHWVLSFYPFVFIALAQVLTIKQWKRSLYLLTAFSVVHLLVISVILFMPVQTFANKKEAMQNLTMGKYPDEVFSKLESYKDDYVFGSISYGMASTMSYFTREHVYVIGEGSYHAREDDSLSDFSQLDGKNILIFKRTPLNLDLMKKYFSFTEHKTVKIRDVNFELLLGHKFNYSVYYEDVLKQVNQKYYQIPDWLPVGQCEFKDKYGFN